MKNLYPKGKGRIHPSPSVTASNLRSEALAVLRILPAAILALTAALGNDDKEVLAYLIMRSIGGLEEATEQRRCGKPGELHTRLFGCGCFDCYTSFWSRWDCSPDRELIHQAIEAFEDHLATSEGTGATLKGKRRERRVSDPSQKGKKKGKDKEKVSDEISAIAIIEDKSQKSAAEETGEAFAEEVEMGDRGEVFEPAASEGVPEILAAQTLSGGGGDRRKGWADVTAIFNSRLWSLWSPGD
ncbi:uncharacterized protein LOC110093383 [Dendrobium catenatum]|uniref:Uncharacterized protein n=1 Tax=Dendrobium catenatum TaxID=906689 RepID=A0A2I0V723_9ASPA|nr:uncharacterized protein LOC110093383 [Dendrobium catenatum]PKU59206.1 hypothetical protein MA16_Dca026201 [Dendrobium catenatum]